MKTVNKVYNRIEILLIAIFCAAMLALDFVKVEYLADSLRNALLSKIIQQGCGAIAAILLLRRLNIKLYGNFSKVWIYLIPCFIIAIDNFQFSAYFHGKMSLTRTEWIDFLLFGGYCLAVGLFEECIFRGVIFSIIAGLFPKNKKGFIYTYVTSSAVFGLAHVVNGISVQILYTVLTGGLFAFCLIKTRNIFCCAAVHGVYNFCGLLFGAEKDLGLGNGVVFDLGTVITMLIVSVVVGLFVVYKTWTYSEQERVCLYADLGVKPSENKE